MYMTKIISIVKSLSSKRQKSSIVNHKDTSNIIHTVHIKFTLHTYTKRFLEFLITHRDFRTTGMNTFSQIIIVTQPAITCSKLTIETLEQGLKYVQSYKDTRTPGVFIVNFEHISHLALVFLLLTLSR